MTRRRTFSVAMVVCASILITLVVVRGQSTPVVRLAAGDARRTVTVLAGSRIQISLSRSIVDIGDGDYLGLNAGGPGGIYAMSGVLSCSNQLNPQSYSLTCVANHAGSDHVNAEYDGCCTSGWWVNIVVNDRPEPVSVLDGTVALGDRDLGREITVPVGTRLVISAGSSWQTVARQQHGGMYDGFETRGTNGVLRCNQSSLDPVMTCDARQPGSVSVFAQYHDAWVPWEATITVAGPPPFWGPST